MGRPMTTAADALATVPLPVGAEVALDFDGWDPVDLDERVIRGPERIVAGRDAEVITYGRQARDGRITQPYIAVVVKDSEMFGPHQARELAALLFRLPTNSTSGWHRIEGNSDRRRYTRPQPATPRTGTATSNPHAGPLVARTLDRRYRRDRSRV